MKNETSIVMLLGALLRDYFYTIAIINSIHSVVFSVFPPLFIQVIISLLTCSVNAFNFWY